MASHLLRNISVTNIIRQSSLCKVQKRSTSGSTNNTKDSRSIGLSTAVGVSLGLSLGLLAQKSVIDRFFPSQPATEKVTPTIDPKVLEELISQTRKINQLENQMSNLKQDLREKDQQLAHAPQASSKSGADVFELSQMIEAINLANANVLKRELEEQRKVLVREHLLAVDGAILKTENKYKPIMNKVKELELHLETQHNLQESEAPARLLWISCQALLDRLKHSTQGPLEKDPAYDVLKQFAAKNNPLATIVLDLLPAKALREGVHSEESLTDRFNKVEKICKRVALVGENGGGIAKYLVSYLQSLFIIDNVKVSEDEVTGKTLADPLSWNTFDILARVKYCLSEHNLEQALRYANQLRGQARVVARDWIRDARVHLETRQAFSTLSAHAEAIAIDANRQAFAK